MNGSALQTYLRLLSTPGIGPGKAMKKMQKSHPTFRCPNLKYHDKHGGYRAITGSDYDVNDAEFRPSFYNFTTMAASVPEQSRRRRLPHETDNALVRFANALIRTYSSAPPQQFLLSRQDLQHRRLEHFSVDHGNPWTCRKCTFDNTNALYLACEVCRNTST